MATLNEKLLAQAILTLKAEVILQGVEFSEKAKEEFCIVEKILEQPTEFVKPAQEGVRINANGFTYIGLKQLELDLESRKKAGRACRFVVQRGNDVVLEMFWDCTLTFVMQPIDEEKTRFCKGQRLPIPKAPASWRPFFKKLAELETEKPGNFEESYYNLTKEEIEAFYSNV